MIKKARSTVTEMNSIRLEDEIELCLYNYNKPEDQIRVIVKVIGFIKEEKCSSCGCLLHERGQEFMRKIYCNDCLIREKDRRSKLTGHRPPDKFFGSMRSKKSLT